MNGLPWKPWHQVVRLRDDLKTGDLPLHLFAADLHDVVMQKQRRKIYEDPGEFFCLTCPTYNLRELVRKVLLRLAGKSNKAVHRLELTYGGGKTHTLITLYHLARDPQQLPALAAVEEFKVHAGVASVKACVATLCFDKLDVERGMEVRAPDGRTRWLRYPWSVLAFQLAGNEVLRLLTGCRTYSERESATAENLLTELLALPQRQGCGFGCCTIDRPREAASVPRAVASVAAPSLNRAKYRILASRFIGLCERVPPWVSSFTCMWKCRPTRALKPVRLPK